MTRFSTLAATVGLTAMLVAGASTPAMAIGPVVVSDTIPTAANYNFVAVSNDGAQIAVNAEGSGGVEIFDVATKTSRTITLPSGDLGHTTFSADGKALVVADFDNNLVRILDLSTDSEAYSYEIFHPWLPLLSPDGGTLYVSNYEGGLLNIDLGTDVVSSVSDVSSGYINSMCISVDGATLYVPDYDYSLAVINTSTFLQTDNYPTGLGSNPSSCQMDNDGNLYVSTYQTSDLFKFAPDGTELAMNDSITTGLYESVPGCDNVYAVDETNQDVIPVLSPSDLAVTSTINPVEMPQGSGFYGVYGARSGDGTVIAIGGYWATDGLVIISCTGTTPDLPNTGVDAAAFAAIGGFALLAIAAGVFVLVARRRKA